jgi:3-methyl-2-oxobutanoate hydroxymethyltransferase
MGHVGLTPQSSTALGGYRTQGRSARSAVQIADDALALQDAGCFAIVFEAIPAPVTETIMERLRIPVIGIGAGPATDGQVLVFHDLLGLHDGRSPRFVRRFAELKPAMVDGVRSYAAAVRDRSFPADEHCYGIDRDELEMFREIVVPGRAWDIADDMG